MIFMAIVEIHNCRRRLQQWLVKVECRLWSRRLTVFQRLATICNMKMETV